MTATIMRMVAYFVIFITHIFLLVGGVLEPGIRTTGHALLNIIAVMVLFVTK